jgi:hypothetical protein
MRDFFGATINDVLRLAATGRDRTARLAALWTLGSRNEDLLQSLFALYEPIRRELRAQGLTVDVVRQIGAGQAAPAGAWSIATSTRLTEVAVNAPDVTVTSPSDIAAREAALFDYAAPASAHVRTRFLAQWQRLRASPGGGHLPPLTDEELDRRCCESEGGLNYVVRRVAAGADGRATLEVDRAGYGQIMRSCDYLIDEAYVAAGLCAQGRPLALRGRWLLRALPARRTALRGGVTELLTAPVHRAVGVGLAATVVTQHADEQARLYYTRRSFQVGTYPGLYHAIPTGMFNGDPAGGRPHDQRTHPGRMMLTEFFEELRGATDLADPGAAAGRVDLLRAHLARLSGPPMRIWVTGVAFDLLSLRPEICCVMTVPPESMAEVVLNDESDGFFAVPGAAADAIDKLPRSTEWVRSGYATLALAYAALDRGLDPDTACEPSDFGI